MMSLPQNMQKARCSVAVLTFHNAFNYGAALQAYATRKVLESQGFRVVFPTWVPEYMRHGLSRTRELYSNWGFFVGGAIRRVPISLRLKIENFSRQRAFDEFRKKEIPEVSVSGKRELRERSSEFHAFVVGSDQVWNLNWMRGRTEGYYFLDFLDGNSTVRKVSYAACFGRGEQPARHMRIIGDWLRRFDAISVRNELSKRLVKEATGRNAEIVVDPTLLWDFSEFIPKNKQQHMDDYIFLYALDHGSAARGGHLAGMLKAKQGWRLIQAMAERPFTDAAVDERAFRAGPKEWVRLLHGARVIVTDSFHACVFASKFQKPVLFCGSGWRVERVRAFVEATGCSGILCVENDFDTAIKEILKSRLEKMENRRMEEAVLRSREFLVDALS